LKTITYGLPFWFGFFETSPRAAEHSLSIVWELQAHGNLESWARRGVFLLNASLTVQKANANSHAKVIIAYLESTNIFRCGLGIIYPCW
jgi:hypothetical protein